jgi:hypothetical protein
MAMDNATSGQGIAFRWYNDNDADLTPPWDGNEVVVEAGFEVMSSPVIRVTYNSEPLDTVTINKTLQFRYHAYNDDINETLSDVYAGEPVGWCAFEQIGDVACEFRTMVNYDVRPEVLGFDWPDVVSATLNFSTTCWQTCRDAVTVDQVVSNLVNRWDWDMYGQTIKPRILSNESATGTHSVDITQEFKEAMQYATETQGIGFRWYNDNDADPTPPWNGNTIDVDAGFEVANSPTIVVGYNSKRCGDMDTYYFPEDLNHDCKVGFKDFALMAANWIDLAE